MRFSRASMGMVAAAILAASIVQPAQAQEQEPPLSRMRSAVQLGGKIGVPVDLRYEVAGVAARDQPVSLHLALVPRVPGSALRLEFPPTAGVSVETDASMSVQKATVPGVYRRSLLVTPRKADAGQLRALVTMEVEGGRYFGVFLIPVGGAPAGKNGG